MNATLKSKIIGFYSSIGPDLVCILGLLGGVALGLLSNFFIDLKLLNESRAISTFFDLIGNKLQTTNKTTISLRDYSKGIYILKVAYGDKVKEEKVIKD